MNWVKYSLFAYNVILWVTRLVVRDPQLITTPTTPPTGELVMKTGTDSAQREY